VTIGRETVVNRRIVKNTGVNGGFVGCIKSLKMSSADQIHVYNFTLDQSSTDLLKYSDIGIHHGLVLVLLWPFHY